LSIREEIRKQFEGMSRDEIIKALKDDGFNVTDGTGKITITDDTK